MDERVKRGVVSSSWVFELKNGCTVLVEEEGESKSASGNLRKNFLPRL